MSNTFLKTSNEEFHVFILKAIEMKIFTDTSTKKKKDKKSKSNQVCYLQNVL